MEHAATRKLKNKNNFDLKVRVQDLHPRDRVLLKKMGVPGKHKLADRWRPQPYVICKILPGLPVYQIKPKESWGLLRCGIVIICSPYRFSSASGFFSTFFGTKSTQNSFLLMTPHSPCGASTRGKWGWGDCIAGCGPPLLKSTQESIIEAEREDHQKSWKSHPIGKRIPHHCLGEQMLLKLYWSDFESGWGRCD